MIFVAYLFSKFFLSDLRAASFPCAAALLCELQFGDLEKLNQAINLPS